MCGTRVARYVRSFLYTWEGSDMFEGYLRQELNKMTLEQLRERCSPDVQHLTKEELIELIVGAKFGDK